MRGLYVHIPFCKAICTYCDFPKIIAKHDIHIKYTDKLLEEIDSYNEYLDDIDTVYFGGGTPNSIDLALLERLFKRLEIVMANSKECSIELNSELITEELCVLLAKYHINRVSIGVQTINDSGIKLLNRAHNRNIVRNSVELLRHHGITNINMDFIFGIPYQTIDDVKKDLAFINEMNLTHVSYYSLILEEKTILEYKLSKGEIELPDDDLVADMYELIRNELKKMGYHHYEISNFAKEGFESIHNLKYWSQMEYIGVGNSSAGYLNGIRYQNERIVSKYIKNNVVEELEITDSIAKQEFFMLGLRKIDGVSINEYISKYKTDPFKEFKINELINKGLLELKDDYLKISDKYVFVGNLVFEEFVGD